MLSNLKNKTILGGRWETTARVGEGACAQVYTVRPVQSTVPYELVAKVVPFTGGTSKAHKQQDRICNTLNYEYMMYNGLLIGFPYCPRVPDKFYGDDKDLKVRYLVMEKMDRDLESVATSGSVLTSSYIAQLGLTILEGLKWIHQKNFLFIDVKPANFMLKGDKLYFVDFGLVERLQVMPAGKTAPSHSFAGTPTFCSVAAHNGEQSGAHDDLEALGLVLLSLTSGGKLPWSVATSDEECKRMKEQCDIAKLCAERGLPEVGELILRCRNAVRTVRPDYDALTQLLVNMHTRKPSAVKTSVKSSVKTAPAGKTKTASAEVAEAVEAPVAKKRAVSAKKTAAASSVEIPTFDTLAVSSSSGGASPVGKRSRTARSVIPATAEVIDLEAPEAPSVSTGRPKRGAAARAEGTSGPFSSASTAAQPDEEGVLSPARSTRTRPMRLSTSSVQSEGDPTSGPFSATFKAKGASSAVPVSGAKASPRAKTAAPPAPVESDKRTFVFSVKKGPCKGTEIILSSHGSGSGAAGRRGAAEQVLTVGRGAECDYALSDDYLSESHFNLVVSQHQPYIVDARSTNGTKLNGGKVSTEGRTELHDGDVIKAGKTELVFHVAGAK